MSNWVCINCGELNPGVLSRCWDCGELRKKQNAAREIKGVTPVTRKLPLFQSLGVTPKLISLPSVFDVFHHLLPLLPLKTI